MDGVEDSCLVSCEAEPDRATDRGRGRPQAPAKLNTLQSALLCPQSLNLTMSRSTKSVGTSAAELEQRRRDIDKYSESIFYSARYSGERSTLKLEHNLSGSVNRALGSGHELCAMLSQFELSSRRVSAEATDIRTPRDCEISLGTTQAGHCSRSETTTYCLPPPQMMILSTGM